MSEKAYTTIELCAGGGGQALGLEQAGFAHLACVEYEPDFCKTLQLNRPDWTIICQDIREFDGTQYGKCDLLAGGVPCPPFSIAGKQLGSDDERDMFPAALAIARDLTPRAVMLENVKGLFSAKFAEYRSSIVNALEEMGYVVEYRLLEASDFGVPQLRPRFILIAMNPRDMGYFTWPTPCPKKPTVGETIGDLLAEEGWRGAKRVAEQASSIAPTIVGGSKKHGGPDLGPTRARLAWEKLGINGKGLADKPPQKDFPEDGLPKLTVRMAARIQGFPDAWRFYGGKTTQYRQVGNALPPPLARAVGEQVRAAFERSDANEAENYEKAEQGVQGKDS